MKQGFTLVELAIVIVIIGLLTGGVMAGRGLIEQAQIVKDVKEMRAVKLAFNTFISKYNYPPGDVPRPTRFFPLCDTQLWGAQGNTDEVTGDGDGYIYALPSPGNYRLEAWCAWMQLAKAGLYNPIGPDKDFRSPDNPTQNIDFANGDAFAQMIWPGNDRSQQIADLLDENSWIGGKKANILMMFGNYEITGEIGFTTPEIAQRLDSKIDDGKPTGLFRAYNIVGSCITNASGYFATTSSDYDFNEPTKTCALGYDMQ